jgi:UPF0271 protein
MAPVCPPGAAATPAARGGRGRRTHPCREEPAIDLNCDLAEGFGVYHLGDDAALLAIVTSANVACGFHGGDPSTIRRACTLAAERGVRVGAQVSFRDLAGFGRRDMTVPPDELADEVLYQIAAVDGIARSCGGGAAYVKPHGALYHAAARRPEVAGAVVAAVRAYDRPLQVLGFPGGELARACAAEGVPFHAEGFADRRYTPAGDLVARTDPTAVITTVDDAVAQALSLASGGGLASLCVHGDTAGAVGLAAAVRAALEAAGVPVAPFAPPPESAPTTPSSPESRPGSRPGSQPGSRPESRR